MNILLPTDFSENADLACDYAFDLAKKSGGQVLALNAYDLPYSDRSLTTSLLEVMKENAEKNMAKFKAELEKYGVPFKTKVSMGNPIRVIKEEAAKDEIDAVVMGTKGASGLEEVLIGSNAASVIQNTQKPVLIIPPSTKLTSFDKLIFASDFDLDQQEKALHQLKNFADIYGTKIDVLHVQGNLSGKAGSRSKFNEILGSALEEFTITQTSNIEQAINEEANKENADLVAVISKSYGFFEGLFHRSLSSKLAYHTHLPLLVLHEPKQA
jgi:nucleotide-binding universal stress UspA family protein